MSTTYTYSGKIGSWKKFVTTLVLGLLGLLLGAILKMGIFQWGGSFFLLLAACYGIHSLMEYIDRFNNS